MKTAEEWNKLGFAIGDQVVITKSAIQEENGNRARIVGFHGHGCLELVLILVGPFKNTDMCGTRIFHYKRVRPFSSLEQLALIAE